MNSARKYDIIFPEAYPKPDGFADTAVKNNFCEKNIMYQTRDFEIFPVSALEKVFGGRRPQLFENEGSAFQNERASFQIAYRSVNATRRDVVYAIDGIPDGKAEIKIVEPVPCSYPRNENSDDYLLIDAPALVPDLLREVSPAGIVARCGVWQSFYVTLSGLPAGRHEIRFRISAESGELLGETEYTLNVLSESLPSSDLVCTFWMHYDSLAEYYREPLFSERYDRILKSFIGSAVRHGLTMLLVPLFTPPLDTEFGKERMTVQLVDVLSENGRYSFDFTRLGRFLGFARECGVKYFEMSHLFSQWGAKYAPKIVAKADGAEKRIFGWDTEALSDTYKEFLAAFLPKLREWLIREGVYGDCYFHISDEPGGEVFGHYRECHNLVKTYLPDARFIDALSHYEYYEEGLVNCPFVALDATEAFIEKGAKDYFVYYCTGQKDKYVSNRFLSMPLERTRVLGMQMYLNDVKGFLQWGYNYYYAFLSREPVDPFVTTDCRGMFQSGDSFIVYPGREGALESLRNEAFYQGIQDYCALRLLERKIGRERTVRLLTENGMGKNFSDYPKSALWLSGLRRKINALIASDGEIPGGAAR